MDALKQPADLTSWFDQGDQGDLLHMVARMFKADDPSNSDFFPVSQETVADKNHWISQTSSYVSSQVNKLLMYRLTTQH